MKYFFALMMFALYATASYPQQEPARVSIAQLTAIDIEKTGERGYFDSVDNFLFALIAQGNFYSKDTLIKHLRKFELLAWSKKDYSPYRIKYFNLLANNASLQNKYGEAIYFLKKLEQEQLKANIKNSLYVTVQLCDYFTNTQQFAASIQQFNKHKDYIIGLSKTNNSHSVDLHEVKNAIYVLNHVNSAFIGIKDTTQAKFTIALAQRIKNATSSDTNWLKEDLNAMDFLINCMQYFYYSVLLKNKNESFDALYRMDAIASSEDCSPEWKSILEYNVLDLKIDYFITFGYPDSASLFLEKLLLKRPPTDPKQINITTNTYKYKIWKLKNKQNEIPDFIDDLLNSKDTINKELTNQVNDLLYAYTEAEYKSGELEKAEKEKRFKTNILIIICILTCLTAIIVYLWIRNKKSETKKQIDTINELANMKISSLQEVKNQELFREQEKIAQDLHDNFSGTLAGAKHTLESLSIDIIDLELRQKLIDVEKQLQNLYEIVRDKSHKLNYDANLMQYTSFVSSLNYMINNALPDVWYNKDIQIDPDAIRSLTLDDRINILRIVQESITNCIKHSKCNEVSIYLFVSNGSIHLHISDNGRGIYNNKSKDHFKMGIGMKSIYNRVDDLNGTIEVLSEEGTTLLICFPAKKEFGIL